MRTAIKKIASYFLTAIGMSEHIKARQLRAESKRRRHRGELFMQMGEYWRREPSTEEPVEDEIVVEAH